MLPKSLFEPQAIADLENRLDKLTAATSPQWGKMNAPQMLNHCSSQIEIILGDKTLKSNFLFRLLGKWIKRNILAGKPTKKNSPTAKELLPVNVMDFEKEKAKIMQLMHRVKEAESSLEGKDHPFFGKMTAEEYGKVTWNHLDYHFGQFGI
ncbi:MAG: DUF1569 domain-containing protein [Spirosomataceae bacterium]